MRFFRFLWVMTIFLSACAPVQDTPQQNTPAISTASAMIQKENTAVATSTANPTPTPTPIPEPAATPTPIGGSEPIIAHFYFPEDAAVAEEQGVYLTYLGSKSQTTLVKSMPDVTLALPLLQFSPDGQYLLIAPNYPKAEPAANSKTLDVFELVSGELHSLTTLNPDIEIRKVAWSPDSQWIMVLYYYFGASLDQIDLFYLQDGSVISVGEAVFYGWLPDSSGIIIQQGETASIFSLQTGQTKPYALSNPPDKLEMREFLLLPEKDAVLMSSGEDLFLVPGLANLISTGWWDVDAVQQTAKKIGLVPAMTNRNFQAHLSPAGDYLMISSKPYEEDYRSYVYRLDGSAPAMEFPGLLGLAWAPDGSAILGIRYTEVSYRGNFSVSKDPLEAGFIIQPLDVDTEPATIFTLTPVCGLVSEDKSAGRSLDQRRVMMDCARALEFQDVFWK